MVALPSNLFTNTTIPACVWFLTKNKRARSRPGLKALRDRQGETLFIDARKLGYMKDRVLRDFSSDDLGRITGTFARWKTCDTFANDPGFSFSAELATIAEQRHVLTPGRFVGNEEVDDGLDGFEEQMGTLAAELAEQFAESSRLENLIRNRLESLGYGI
jgi:type I restriction enzyme M protein